MSVCRAGMNCNHVAFSEAVPLGVPGAVALQRTPDEIKAAVQAKLQPLIVCWRLRDDIRNGKFLRNASGALAGGGVLGTSVWGAIHSENERKKGLMVGGGVTALGIAGLAHQSYNVSVAEKAFLSNNCPELIAAHERGRARVWMGVSQSSFSNVVRQKLFAIPEAALAMMGVGASPGSGRKITWVIETDEEGRHVYRPKIEAYALGMDVPAAAGSSDDRPVSEEAVAFGVANIDFCEGADVLIRGCRPQRTLPKVYEYSTDVKEVQRQQLILGGILVAPAVVVYAIPAGISALTGWGEGIAALLNGARPLAASL